MSAVRTWTRPRSRTVASDSSRAPASAPPLARAPYSRARASALSAPLTAGISVLQIDGSGAFEQLVEARRDQRVVRGARALDAREHRGDVARRGAEMPQPRPDGLGDELAGGLVDADVQPFDAERLRDLRAGELRQATAAGHATGEAGDQPSVGDGVVRGPLRRRAHVAGGEAFLHREMVEQVLGALGDRAHAPQAGAVGEEIADGDAPLAARGELRPVRRDGLVVGELAAFREPVDDRRRDALRRGEA